MTAVTLELPLDSADIPEYVSTRWCADTFGITTASVATAINQGRLPAERFGHIWAIRSEDALRMWSPMLFRRARQQEVA